MTGATSRNGDGAPKEAAGEDSRLLFLMKFPF